MLQISELLVNYCRERLPVAGSFNVGWILESDHTGVLQTGYRLRIFSEDEPERCVYDTGDVSSDESAHVRVDALPDSIKKYTLSVAVTDNFGDRAEGCTGLISGFADNDTHFGKYISAEKQEAEKSAGTLLRKEFTVLKQVKNAFLVSTACGMYEAFMNGEKIGNDYLAPGWTSYDTHQQYQVVEITDLVKNGENAIGVSIGAGWFKGTMSYNLNRNHYGTQTAFSGCVVLDYADGTRELLLSDETWKGTHGPVLFSEIYDGELYDARLEKSGWTCSGYDDADWEAVSVLERKTENLMLRECRGVEIMNVLKGKKITTPKNETVIDFGQNITGWCQFMVKGASEGDRIELQCFETLDAEGNVYTANLRTAKQKITYICSGNDAVYRPHFTFQGFRYVHVQQWPGTVDEADFSALVLHTGLEETGSFRCSDELINRLQHNIIWSMKGNFVDVPTDCPQRDERLGWTGDVQIFNSTALFLMNTYGFFSKWLRDVAADQTEEGAVPHVVPDIVSGKSDEDWLTKQGCSGASGWADVAVILPWNMYLAYGDTAILERQYDSMKSWIDFMKAHSVEGCLFSYKLQFGDWVALDAEEGSYFGATPTAYTSAAFYCYTTKLFAEIAKICGKKEDYEVYYKLACDLKKSFAEHFLREDGTPAIDTQTAQILALQFDLIPEDAKTKTASCLKKLIEENGGHLVTGFMGTPYICHALSDNGFTDEAYELLLKQDFPSWLYQVTKGATTVWEHWDGLKPDGSMWSPDMNSFNHYSYGSIGEWIYKNIGGLSADAQNPGYHHFTVSPKINGKLRSAEMSFRSIYGTIASSWKLSENGKLLLDVTVPVNTSASVSVNGIPGTECGSGGHHFEYDLT